MSIIYWDFDGTITYSNPLWSGTVYDSLKQIAPDTGVEFAEIRKCMATGFTWHSPDNDYTAFKNDKWWDFMNDKIAQDYISLGIDKDLAVKAALLVRENIKKAESYTLYGDAVFTLKELKEHGHTNIILSNNYPDLTEVIKKLKLAEYFDGYVISAVEGYDKPRAELFDIAKKYNKEKLPMFMIGDSENADIIGGNNAGMTTIYVHRGISNKADYCCNTLKEIVEIIKEISFVKKQRYR